MKQIKASSYSYGMVLGIESTKIPDNKNQKNQHRDPSANTLPQVTTYKMISIQLPGHSFPNQSLATLPLPMFNNTQKYKGYNK